jgi:hypothetical protein
MDGPVAPEVALEKKEVRRGSTKIIISGSKPMTIDRRLGGLS